MKNNRLIKIRKLTHDDVMAILPNIRKSDRAECECIAGRSIEAILARASKTTEAYAGLANGQVIALFGVNVEEGTPLVWMVAADDFERPDYRQEIIRLAQRWIELFIQKYQRLTNHVHLKNRKAVKFLRFLGARFGEAITVNNETVAPFWFGGESECVH